MSDSDVSEPPPRKIVLLTKPKKSMRLGPMTLAFFRKGEELESTDFQNLPHDDPALVPPKLGFRNFEKVPRNYAPLALAFLVVVAGCLTVLGWSQVRGQMARAATAAQATVSSAWVRLRGIGGARQAAPAAEAAAARP